MAGDNGVSNVPLKALASDCRGFRFRKGLFYDLESGKWENV